MKKYLDTLLKAIAAGVAITLGCTVYLNLLAAEKALGALLFSTGLFSICTLGMNLFTGRIGHALESDDKLQFFVIWLGNLLGCLVFGFLISLYSESVVETAAAVVAKKLDKSVIPVAVSAAACGILMLFAVDSYKKTNHIYGIVVCVMTFILSDFEHSVADMGYVAIALFTGRVDILRSLIFILIVSVFNGAGAIALNALIKGVKTDKN